MDQRLTAVQTGEAADVLPVRTHVVSTYREFLELEPQWNRLVELSGIDHPFSSHFWIRTWWEAFGTGRELHIVTASQGEELVGAAPLMFSREKIYGIPVRQVGFIYNVHTPRFDFIVARHVEQVYEAIWKHLAEIQREWDVIKICQLPEGSPTLNVLPRLARAGGHPVGLWASSRSPFIPLPADWEEYFCSVSRSRRSSLKRSLAKLEERGSVTCEWVCQEAALEGALDDTFRIEEMSWKGAQGTAIRCQPEVESFYRNLAGRALGLGALRLAFLRCGGSPIAVDYCLSHGRKIFTLKPSFDPAYRVFGPGQLLRMMTIRGAIEQGFSEFDLLGDIEKWKLEWTQEARSHYWMFIFSHLRGELLHYTKFRVLPWARQRVTYAPLRERLSALRSWL